MQVCCGLSFIMSAIQTKNRQDVYLSHRDNKLDLVIRKLVS